MLSSSLGSSAVSAAALSARVTGGPLCFISQSEIFQWENDVCPPRTPSTCPSTCRLPINIHPLSVSQHWTFPSGELVRDQGTRKRTLELMSHIILGFYNYCFLRLPPLLWPLQFYFPKSTAQHSSADSKYKQRAGLTCLLMQYTCNVLLILSAQSLTKPRVWWCELLMWSELRGLNSRGRHGWGQPSAGRKKGTKR